MQVLDVSVNKPFKTQARDQFEEHLNENMERYMNGEILVRERRILTTHWIANAWSYICLYKNIVKRGFKKCGINVALDGNENSLVNIEGLPDYEIPIGDLSEEYTLEDESDSDENIGEDENPSDEDPSAENFQSDSDEESNSDEIEDEDFGNDQVVVVRRPAFVDFYGCLYPHLSWSTKISRIYICM